jgi:hypothetical protein
MWQSLFLVSLLLFHIGVQHNPEAEFIDLGSRQLDLGYSALFFAQNMVVLLILPLGIELALAIWARLRGQRIGRNHVRGWLCRALVMSAGAALAIAAVATYAAWRHGQGDIDGTGALIWACAGLFLRSAVFFFAAILAAAIIVHFALAVGWHLVER